MTTTNFGDVQVYTGQEMEMKPAAPAAGTALANIEQSRAVAEVQAAIVLAKSNPRNEESAYSEIMKSCKRSSLAERATYEFKRGTNLVIAPSIRLAEVLARCWGNLQYGFHEIGRGNDFSEVEAFAYDLQSNVKVTRKFQVKHWRDTRKGGHAVTAERDKYELVASMAQRRVRSCLLELIPGDIVDAAQETCQATLMRDIGDMDEQIQKILAAFAEYEVTPEDIEKYLQRAMRSMVPADVANLKRIYRSIRDGIAPVSDFFPKEKSVVETNEDPPETKKTASAPEKVKSQEKKRPQVPNIETLKTEIASYTTELELDRFVQKHLKRIEAMLPSTTDRQALFAYAEQHRKNLTPAIPEESGAPELIFCPQGQVKLPKGDCESCPDKTKCPAWASKLNINI